MTKLTDIHKISEIFAETIEFNDIAIIEGMEAMLFMIAANLRSSDLTYEEYCAVMNEAKVMYKRIWEEWDESDQ